MCPIRRAWSSCRKAILRAVRAMVSARRGRLRRETADREGVGPRASAALRVVRGGFLEQPCPEQFQWFAVTELGWIDQVVRGFFDRRSGERNHQTQLRQLFVDEKLGHQRDAEP